MYIITIVFLVAWRALALFSSRRALRKMERAIGEEETAAEVGQH